LFFKSSSELFEQDENINIEYHKKRPIQLTLKNFSKEENKTDELRSSLHIPKRIEKILAPTKRSYTHHDHAKILLKKK
jgi:hypothetical protein